ncbi:MAG: cyclic nucleotide-binding/CBS domain-containing protein [Thermoproteota archaeon]
MSTNLIKRIQNFKVKDVLEVSSPVNYQIKSSDPVIVAAPFLTVFDVDVVFVTKEESVHGFIGGYILLEIIKQSGKNAWSALYKTPSENVDWKLLTTRLNEELDILLRKMMATGYGHALVLDKDKLVSPIGLLDIAKFFLYSGITDNLEDITIGQLGSSPIVSVPPEATILQAISTMIEKRVRRLLVKDRILSDRSLVKALVTYPWLSKLRDSTEETLNSPINTLPITVFHKPGRASLNESLSKGLGLLLEAEAKCLLVNGQIVTPMGPSHKAP